MCIRDRNDSERRIALTEEQLRTWMDFIRQDETYSKYYDEFVVLLDTGLRVSEFCGLTRKDLDFKNRRIRVDHQLLRELGGKYHVEATKTTRCTGAASGIRFIPMTLSLIHIFSTGSSMRWTRRLISIKTSCCARSGLSAGAAVG